MVIGDWNLRLRIGIGKRLGIGNLGFELSIEDRDRNGDWDCNLGLCIVHSGLGIGNLDCG